MRNQGRQEAPGAAATAPGAEIANVEARATARAYARSRQPRNVQSLRAVGPNGAFVAKGQVARTLAALVAAGGQGVTALECSGWAFRLAAYVHELRHVHGLSVDMEREAHDGGFHGRYRLRSPVRLEMAP